MKHERRISFSKLDFEDPFKESNTCRNEVFETTFHFKSLVTSYKNISCEFGGRNITITSTHKKYNVVYRSLQK